MNRSSSTDSANESQNEDETEVEKIDQSGEDRRLGNYTTMKTILTLTVGPLISQMVQAFYGLCDSLWVAKTIGDQGIAVFGAIFIVEFIAVAFSNYLMTGLNVRTSYLFGEGKGELISQMYVDFVRIAMILGIIIPIVVLPITKPLVEWFGADKELSDMCLIYMYPCTCACFLNFLYMMGCGLLQAEGRSLAYGLVQAGSFALNMGVFDPLFLVGLKTPIWGASLATIIAEGIPGIILTGLIFAGKLSPKPKLKMFFAKFSPETWHGMKVGFASFISAISYTLPLILMQKYVNSAATAIGEYDVTIEIWAIIEKLYQVVGGICVAFSYGLLPAASYAFGAQRYNRVLWVFIHTTWISTVISVVFSIFMIAIPDKIAQIWSSDEHFLQWSKKMIPKVFYVTMFISYQYQVPALLQAMQLVASSTALSILTLLLPMPIFSSILYFTNKSDPARILYTYALNDTFAFVACTFFLIKPWKLLWKAPRDSEIYDPETGAINVLTSNPDSNVNPLLGSEQQVTDIDSGVTDDVNSSTVL